MIAASFGAGPADAQGAASARRERRRENIEYRPPVGAEYALAASMKGEVAGSDISAESAFHTIVERIDKDGLVYARMHLTPGKCQAGSGVYDTDTGAEWMAVFDSRHILQRVELITPPREGQVGADEVLDLASVMMYVFFSVAYHVRSAGVGTVWNADYSTIDMNGRKLYVHEKSRLVRFLWEGDRRVALIESTCDVPIRARLRGVQVAGTVNSRIVSEVYVDTGEIRYRRSVGDGPLTARAGGFSVDIDVDDLVSVLRATTPDGRPVEPLDPESFADKEHEE